MKMNFAGRELDLSRCHVMGILNVTPDSFSDGGQFNRPGAALTRARQMVADGATFIDIGGESTRPGATPVSVQEELDRVCPVVEAAARELDAVISVDTSAPEVMAETAKLGAGLINDVRALQRDGAPEVAAQAGIPVCIMHIQGEPDTMQDRPEYRNVRREVSAFLTERMRVAELAGIRPENILLDPGFGFGKTLAHNIALLKSLDELVACGYPVLAGMSRKSMIPALMANAGYSAAVPAGRAEQARERLGGSLTLALYAAAKGAHIVRVHDVRETLEALTIRHALDND